MSRDPKKISHEINLTILSKWTVLFISRDPILFLVIAIIVEIVHSVGVQMKLELTISMLADTLVPILISENG